MKEEEKQQADPLLGYVQISVEKYLFTKVFERLFAMYQYKFEEADTLFIEKSYYIKQLKQEDVMKNLDIKDKFIFAESL